MSRLDEHGYSAVLKIPYARRIFSAALFGRFAFAVLPLSAIFTFQERTGSFAVASGAVAGYGLTTVTLPLKARLVDRHGQLRVLAPLAAIAAACVGSAAAISGLTSVPAIVPICLFVLGGAAVPPLGPSMRSNWRAMTIDYPDRKQSAYALDSTCEEVLFLVGPLSVGIIITLFPAWIGLIGAAALLLIGTFTMVVARPIRLRQWDNLESEDQSAGCSSATRLSTAAILRIPGLLTIVAAIFALAGGVSIVYISLAELATAEGNRGAAGYIEACMALASVVGGLVWGKLSLTRVSRAVQLGGLLGVLAIAILLTGVVANSLWTVAVGLSIAGLAIAPTFISAYLASDDVAPVQHKAEASSWVNTAHNLGAAFGSASAGLVVDAVGGKSGLMLSGALLAVGMGVVFASGRMFSNPADEPVSTE